MPQLQHKSYGIKVRYEPALKADLIADIVFVHGLTGSADSTWANEEGSLHWPSQLLCQDIADVRVSTFGYDADVVSLWNPVSQNRIGNHAENLLGSLVRLKERTNTEALKIIFVAHSLGGLVVEDALDVSRRSTEPHIRQFESCTVGICFLGTPHLGSDLARWGKLGASIAKIFRHANTDIIKVLSPGSEMLSAIQRRFYNVLNHRTIEGSRIAVTCFYEELPMPVGGLVVPEQHAALPGYSKYGIHANHRNMTRFGSRSDIGYIDIVSELQRWIKAIRSGLQTPALTSDHEGAACLRSLHFSSLTLRQDTARDAISGTFEWIWSAKRSCFLKWLQSGSGIFWISGKPGSGKTTMMKYLIANHNRIEHSQKSLDSGQCVTQVSQRLQDNRELILAAHFFDHEGDDLAKSRTGLLRSMLFQLLRARPQLFEAILPRYKEMKRFHSVVSWTRKDLEVAFAAMLRHPECGPVVFFIDALDEAAGERDEIIKFISNFSEISRKTVQFCVSGRPSADFSFHLADSEAQIRLDEHSSQDILHFIRESFQEVASRFGTDYGALVDQIALKAENVFLWVRLIVEDLLRAARRRETIERLQHRLLKMPVQLIPFYQHMIDQSSDYERSEVLQILGIISCAMEPLSLDQLQDALEHCSRQGAMHQVYPRAQQSFHRTLNSAEDFAERIESICFGLVDVRTIFRPMNTRRVVVFSHHTVNEFLGTLEAAGEKHGRPKVRVQGSLDLLRACVDCMVAVDTSGLFQVISLDEQLRRQRLAEENTSSDTKFEWPMVESQSSWTEAELNVQAFVICPFLRYAASHWAQHAKNVEIETSTSCRSILNKLAPVNLRLWSLLMRHSDESWKGIEGRRIVTPSTLLEYAILFGLTRYVEEEVQSYSTNMLKTFRSTEHQLSDHNMNSDRLLYAAATGGNVEIAEALIVWGAKFDPSLHNVSNALARAIYRGNVGVAHVFSEHKALWNTSGVYLEGYSIQSRYRTPDILAVRVGDQPTYLEATPMTLLASIGSGDNLTRFVSSFRNYAGFDTAATAAPVDHMAKLAEWGPEIAIDDFAIAFGRTYRDHEGKATYVLDEDASDAQDGRSVRLHVITVNLLANQDIEPQMEMLKKYKAAYGRLPILNVTAYNLASAVPLDLTRRLSDLGYMYFEHETGIFISGGRFSIENPIPTLE